MLIEVSKDIKTIQTDYCIMQAV